MDSPSSTRIVIVEAIFHDGCTSATAFKLNAFANETIIIKHRILVIRIGLKECHNTTNQVIQHPIGSLGLLLPPHDSLNEDVTCETLLVWSRGRVP
jgi:hypothetical protein